MSAIAAESPAWAWQRYTLSRKLRLFICSKASAQAIECPVNHNFATARNNNLAIKRNIPAHLQLYASRIGSVILPNMLFQNQNFAATLKLNNVLSLIHKSSTCSLLCINGEFHCSGCYAENVDIGLVQA